MGFGVALGGLSRIGATVLPKIGQQIGRILGGGSRVPPNRQVTDVAIRRMNPLTQLARRGAVIGGAGAAFEAGSRLLPGGAPFPGDFSIPGFGGGGGGSDTGDLQQGMRFGDTFITHTWVSGETAEGVPIIHGMLANGKRFSTNRHGGIKVFRPRKNIVIGADPKLSDARKVARAARKMERFADDILRVTGKKAVKR